MSRLASPCRASPHLAMRASKGPFTGPLEARGESPRLRPCPAAPCRALPSLDGSGRAALTTADSLVSRKRGAILRLPASLPCHAAPCRALPGPAVPDLASDSRFRREPEARGDQWSPASLPCLASPLHALPGRALLRRASDSRSTREPEARPDQSQVCTVECLALPRRALPSTDWSRPAEPGLVKPSSPPPLGSHHSEDATCRVRGGQRCARIARCPPA